MLDLILRFSSAQGLGQVVPELEEPRIEHDENAADIAGLRAVEVEGGGGRVEVLRGRAVALAVEEAHCDQCVKEIADSRAGAGQAPHLVPRL